MVNLSESQNQTKSQESGKGLIEMKDRTGRNELEIKMTGKRVIRIHCIHV